MDLMDLYARLTLDSSGYENGLNDAASKASSIGGTLKNGLSAIAKVGAAAIGAATAAVGGMAASSVSAGKTFDASMSQVAATMGVTVDEIGELRDFAKEMGAKTAFSASQAADALNYMALAGYSAEESMQALPNVLNLAAAGGIELAQASDMVTDAQSALGLSMEESAELVDKMAKASSKSNTSVAQLGEAILTVGGTAKNLSGGTTELSTALGILADNGVKGAEGGTALRNIILSLSTPTDKAAKKMEALGLQVFDAQGNMRPLNETFKDLDGILSTMTQEEKMGVLNEIFNKVDLKSAEALLANCGSRFDELSADIDGASFSIDSFAKELEGSGLSMDTMQQNLEKLGVSGDTFKSILESSDKNVNIMSESIWEACNAGVSYQDVIDALGGDLESIQTAFDNCAGAAQAMADTQLDNLQGDITLFQSALEGVQISISEQITPALREFVKYGADALSTLNEAFTENGLDGLMDALPDVLSKGITMITNMVPKMVEAGAKLMVALGRGMAQSLPVLIDVGLKAIDTLGESLVENGPKLRDFITEAVISLVSGIKEYIPKLADSAGELMSNFGEFLKNNLPTIIAKGAEIVTTLIETISENADSLIDGAITLIVKLGEGLINSLPSLIKCVPRILEALIEAIVENAPKLLYGGLVLIGMLVDGLIQAIPELVKAVPRMVSALLQGFNDLMQAFVNVGANIVQGILQGIFGWIDKLIDAAKNMMKKVVGAVKEFLGIASPSKVFAEIGGNMAAGVGEGWSNEFGKIHDDIVGDMDFGTTDVDFQSSNMGQSSRAMVGSVMSAAGQNSTNGGDIVINLTSELDGAVLSHRMLRYNRYEEQRSGSSLTEVKRVW